MGGSTLVDLTGQRFGRLVVLRRGENRIYGTQHHKPKTVWICRCDCGYEGPIVGEAMKCGRSKSCGCMRAETLRSRYKAWRDGLVASSKKELGL